MSQELTLGELIVTNGHRFLTGGGGVAIGSLLGVAGAIYGSKQCSMRKQSDKEKYQTNYSWFKEKFERAQQKLAEYHSELEQVNRQLTIQTQKLQNLNNLFVEEMKGLPLFMAIGLAGQGKSTFCNRLLCDTSKKGNKGKFKTGIGHCVTTQISKQKFTFNRSENAGPITASIIDSPGFDDEKQRDDIFMDNVIECLKECGGITQFLLVISLGDPRPVRGSFIKLLKAYEKRFTTTFWQYTTIVFSNTDKFDLDDEQDIKDKKKLVKTVYESLEIEFQQKPPCIYSGHMTQQYTKAIDKLMKCNLESKFKNTTLKSPLDDLISKQTQLNANIRRKTEEARDHKHWRDHWKQKLDNA